jgi:hypothetical protein
LYFPPLFASVLQFDAREKIFTSWHEILATGCIQAPPKASNLFHGVACLAAFHFVLEVNFCFVGAKLFFVVVEDEYDFESACFASVCDDAE